MDVKPLAESVRRARAHGLLLRKPVFPYRQHLVARQPSPWQVAAERPRTAGGKLSTVDRAGSVAQLAKIGSIVQLANRVSHAGHAA